MAEAEIRQELLQMRSAVDAMRAEHDLLIDRDNRLANRLSEVEKTHAQRLSALEAAYVARNGDRDEGARPPSLKTREAEKFMPETWTGEERVPVL